MYMCIHMCIYIYICITLYVHTATPFFSMKFRGIRTPVSGITVL